MTNTKFTIVVILICIPFALLIALVGSFVWKSPGVMNSVIDNKVLPNGNEVEKVVEPKKTPSNNKGEENVVANQNVPSSQVDTSAWKDYKSEIVEYNNHRSWQYTVKYPNNFFNSYESKNVIAKSLIGTYFMDVSLDSALAGKLPYFELSIAELGGGRDYSGPEGRKFLQDLVVGFFQKENPKFEYTIYDRLIGGVKAVCSDFKNIKVASLILSTKSYKEQQDEKNWTDRNGIFCFLTPSLNNLEKKYHFMIQLYYSPDKGTESKSI
ncbi:MAG: hypothetical protein NTV62_00915, partial [Candidatus Gribaldobacteria bacterium]|nr:hypothetical protein [Candidatus Gribaldobacteria bacterium]